jgi:hypothetical protein
MNWKVCKESGRILIVFLIRSGICVRILRRRAKYSSSLHVTWKFFLSIMNLAFTFKQRQSMEYFMKVVLSDRKLFHDWAWPSEQDRRQKY